MYSLQVTQEELEFDPCLENEFFVWCYDNKNKDDWHITYDKRPDYPIGKTQWRSTGGDWFCVDWCPN